MLGWPTVAKERALDSIDRAESCERAGLIRLQYLTNGQAHLSVKGS